MEQATRERKEDAKGRRCKMARYEEEPESYRNKTIYSYYVVDDGWKLPYEVIEDIDYTIFQTQQYYLNVVKRQNQLHHGDWLTWEVAEKYAAKSWIYRVLYCGQYIREVRKLGQELQESYGVTEMEAINILNEHNVADYVAKYHRIKNMIPLRINQQEICDNVVWEYLHKAI